MVGLKVENLVEMMDLTTVDNLAFGMVACSVVRKVDYLEYLMVVRKVVRMVVQMAVL